MKVIKNNKGVTLVEVLAAMAILSIILISIMNIFPQMGMMNKQNEDKAQAINTAKLLLNEWKLNEKVIAALKISDPQKTDWPEGYVSTEGVGEDAFYFFKLDDPKAEIKIWREPPQQDTAVPAHQIQIRLLNDRGNSLTETYGYIIVE